MKWRSPGAGRWRVMRRRAALGCLAAGIGCDGPHYVSLGWNDSAVSADGAATDGGGHGPVEAPVNDDFMRAPGRDRSLPCSFGPARVELSTACEARPLAACPALGETPELTLDAVLSSVLRECGELDNRLSVSFEQSCALAFELASDAAALSDASTSTTAPSAAAPSGSAAAASNPSDAAAPETPTPSSAAAQSPATDTPESRAAGSASAAAPRGASAATASADGAPDAGTLGSAALDALTPEQAAIRRCIAERLAAQRLDCARDIACGEGVNVPPPTR